MAHIHDTTTEPRGKKVPSSRVVAVSHCLISKEPVDITVSSRRRQPWCKVKRKAAGDFHLIDE
jgi:hypothetical protein